MPLSSEATRRAALSIVLREVMVRKNLTQDALGERCGKDKVYINKLLKMRLGHGHEDMERLAMAAEMTELELYARYWAVRDQLRAKDDAVREMTNGSD